MTRAVPRRAPSEVTNRRGGRVAAPARPAGDTRERLGRRPSTGRAIPRPAGQRPSTRGGHRYSYDYRRGYGYHRPAYGYGRGYRYGYGYRDVFFPGYAYPRVYGSYFYFPGFSFGVGVGHGPLSTHLGYSGYGPYDYGYAGYGSPYYGASAYHAVDLYTGFLRLKVRPRYAQVFADGYYVGVVNEFDGVFQRLRLDEGPHAIEIRHPGFEPLHLDVLIVPGEKVTFEGDLIPQP